MLCPKNVKRIGAFSLGGVLLVAEVVGHLGVEGSLDESSGELVEEAALGKEVLRVVAVLEELVEQLGMAMVVKRSGGEGRAAYTTFWTHPLVDGAALHAPHTATTVHVRAGERLLTGGPFAETKEHRVGYYVIGGL